MKRIFAIGWFVIALFAACNAKKQAPEPVEGPSPTLSAIDSLMWRQPDSAFAILVDYLSDDGRDAARHVSTNEIFDNHYTQLLISELLYKNDYAQTNRRDLQKAMAYFDSIMQVPEPAIPEARRRVEGPSSKCCVFLDARAHYINGVGYYEKDSIVPACEEYLTALEVMEECFGEKELTGHKAQFLAYTYNRLGDLFSSQLMIEQTIDCYDKSRVYNLIHPTSPYGIANAYYHMGIQFDVSGQKETASDYYKQSLQALPDTNNSFYRDIVASMSFLDYQLGHDFDKSMEKMRWLLSQASDEAEKESRYMVIGSMYYESRQYDSALLYLEQVYKNNENAAVRLQVAEYLLGIYQSFGDESKVKEYANFLSQYAVSGYEQKAVQSRLANLYQDYQQKKADDRIHYERVKHRRLYFLITILLVFLIVIATIIVSRRLHKKKLESAQLRHDAELNDLRVINHHLQDENQKLARRQERLPAKAPREEYDTLLCESICMDLQQRFGRTEILTTNKPEEYVALAITPREKQELAKVVMKHCPDFDSILKAHYPSIKTSDLDVCRFFLIGLSEQQMAVLLQKDYSTIWKRVKRLKEMMGFVEPKMHLIRILFENETSE